MSELTLPGADHLVSQARGSASPVAPTGREARRPKRRRAKHGRRPPADQQGSERADAGQAGRKRGAGVVGFTHRGATSQEVHGGSFIKGRWKNTSPGSLAPAGGIGYKSEDGSVHLAGDGEPVHPGLDLPHAVCPLLCGARQGLSCRRSRADNPADVDRSPPLDGAAAEGFATSDDSPPTGRDRG